MRYVKQKHKYGCGVASLAMAAGIGYDRALKLIDPNREKGAQFSGTHLEQVLAALQKMGFGYKIHFDPTNLGTIKNNAYISFSQRCGCRHAVTWDAKNKKILDPDFGKPDHTGKIITFSRQYIRKNANYIVEIIPQ